MSMMSISWAVGNDVEVSAKKRPAGEDYSDFVSLKVGDIRLSMSPLKAKQMAHMLMSAADSEAEGRGDV